MKVEVGVDVAADRLDREMEYATKAQVHLWAVVTTYKVSDAALDTLTTEPLHLDTENIMMVPVVGCLICEEPFTATLRRRRCKGEPR